MTERRSDRVLSIVLSILIHAAIVGALLWGWWQYRQPTATPPSLAIDATVVHDAPPAPATPPPPAPTPPPQAASPPPPTPDQQAEQQARAAEKRAAEEAEQQRQHELAERVAADKAAAEKAALPRRRPQRRPRPKRPPRRRLPRRRPLPRKRPRIRPRPSARRSSWRSSARPSRSARSAKRICARSSRAEEHLNAVQSSPAKAEYLSLITARINRAWIRPPSARAGVKCSLHITQIPGGEITHVVVAGCNGDEAVRQSVETAAYRASPLPAPPDPALFDPNIDVTFAPDE